MNLIPQKRFDTGDYYCTWNTQEFVCGNKDLKKIKLNIRDSLGEELLFGEVGVLNLIPKEIREDLIIVIDDGWDVPYGLKPNFKDPELKDVKYFGSLCLDETRFPTCTGTPQERLKKLNNKIKALGYVGLGLWIAPQEQFKDIKDYSDKASEQYWIERLKWCTYADIKYWKIDWGIKDECDSYRKMINDLAKKYAPKLKIEQAYTQIPFDKTVEYRKGKEYQDRLNRLKFLEDNGDYIRIYDAVLEFLYTTSIQRTIELFLASKNANKKPNCILSTEDCLYIGAALGCSFGAMRMFQIENDPKYHYNPALRRPYNELKRAIMWHRFAPPFAVDKTDFCVDETTYRDSYKFPDKKEPKPWPEEVWGNLYVQDAYAGMSRNMPLAKVEAENEKPYVVCATNPTTNAVSVFASPRTLGGSILYTIRADITMKAKDSKYPIGIFGHYKSLTIDFEDDITGKKVYAQDLATEKCVEITNEIEIINKKSLKISGEIIDRIGLTVQELDIELPGLVVVIE